MALTMQQIVNEIVSYIGKFPSTKYSDWYVGIASSPEDRLFIEHCVDKNGYWIHAEAISHIEARTIEQHLIENLKTKGGPGGGDASTKFVYAYLITSTTKE